MNEPATTQRAPSTFQQTLVWGAFLGSSWTWVIGMVLPVLLCGLFNFWGWLAFAVPNVIGAAAVGFFRYGRTEEEKEGFIQKHLLMLTVFSAVTALFQLFVVAWLLTRLVGPIALAMYVLLTFMFVRMGARDRRADLLTTMGALVLSIGAFAYFCVQGHPSWEEERFFKLPLGEVKNLLWLSSALALGFLACPFMDMTLLRARNALEDRPARWAFGVGFGVFFLAMIVFTLAYAYGLELLPAGVIRPHRVFALVALHIVLQAAVTTALHLGEMRRRAIMPGGGVWAAMGLAGVGMLLLAGLGKQIQLDPDDTATVTRWTWESLGLVVPSYQGLDQGEVVYRCFLSFYAFLFPSYAWTCMFNAPAGSERVTMTRMGIAVTFGIVAAGIAGVGFFANEFFWVFPGVVLILLGPVVAKGIER